MKEKLRAWWSHRQGLDGGLRNKSDAQILESSGWVRGLGGVAPYLALHSRAGISRESVDASIAKLEIHELPAARGCTYIVPACDFALALKAGEPFERAEMNVGLKLGVTEKEIDKLCDALLKALAKKPAERTARSASDGKDSSSRSEALCVTQGLDPEEIREATGSASRSLGEAGKKKGLTTTLPLALGRLQAMGEIRRVSTNGRLDQQRYRYALWRPNPLDKFKMNADEVARELARRFFTWAGPATLTEFQKFAGLGVKASKAAIEPLKLAPFEGARFMLAAHRDQYESFKPPKTAAYSLVANIDGIGLFRGNINDLLAPADAVREVYADRGVKQLGKLDYLYSPAIFDRGRIVGLWEFDPDANKIVTAPFVKTSKELRHAIAETEAYIKSDLGDARSYSMDTPKARAPRIEALREIAGA